MKTFTVSVHGDKDTELLKKIIEETKFQDEIETHEDEDEFTDEDIAEFDRRSAEYERDPSKARSLDEFMKEIKSKYGV